MKSKQNLLITLGCSWTEGVGIYESLNVTDTTKDKDLFHRLGWPNRVGETLGFDKVVNLGYGGASNSSQVKLFYEYIKKINLNNYNILVIFMMTDPVRFSFFIDKSIKSYTLSNKNQKMMQSYLNEIKDNLWDLLLEQKFYIESLENLCLNKDIYLILTSWNETYMQFRKIHNNKNHLFKETNEIKPPIKNNYSFCGHPNANGYEWISKKIIEGIKENHPNWYGKKTNKNLKWEWLGDVNLYKFKNHII